MAPEYLPPTGSAAPELPQAVQPLAVPEQEDEEAVAARTAFFREPSPPVAEAAASADVAGVPSPSAPRRFRLLWAGALLLLVGGGATAAALILGPGRHLFTGSQAGAAVNPSGASTVLAIPVNTVYPRDHTLVRNLEQPGSLEPDAQVELVARVSGYVKRIARDWTPDDTAQVAAQSVASLAGSPVRPLAASLAELATAVDQADRGALQKDIGSPVRAGEILLEIDVPELHQDIAEKESLWKQAVAEVDAGRTAIRTAQAALDVAEAMVKQTEADIRRFESECTYREQEYNRFVRLHKENTLPRDIVDEKRHLLESARSACESCRAKVRTSQLEVQVARSRVEAARSDLLVKEAKAQVALDQIQRARVMASFARVVAPFDGVIAQRAVDEGDFIHTSNTRDGKAVMTVVAVDRVKMTLRVPEREASWIRVGLEALIALDGHDGLLTRGRVARVSPLLDPQTRTLRIEIDLDNTDRKLRPGDYASRVTLVLQKIEHVYSIPATAVYSRKDGNFVFLVDDHDTARLQRIRIRHENGRDIEAVKIDDQQEIPFDGSERVVVSNKGELVDGQKVKATPLTGS